MSVDRPVQTRSEKSGLGYHENLRDALNASERDRTIWKISFDAFGENIRLVRDGDDWFYDPIKIKG